jgi:hypothetical protein
MLLDAHHVHQVHIAHSQVSHPQTVSVILDITALEGRQYLTPLMELQVTCALQEATVNTVLE